MSEIRILGVYVETRGQAAQKVQQILTKYGCSVRTRLGLHTPATNKCKNCGLILLELTGNPDECLRLENELWAQEGVKVQKMVF
jgi:hypothetical protein